MYISIPDMMLSFPLLLLISLFPLNARPGVHVACITVDNCSVSPEGPAIQYPHGGRTRAEGIYRQALSGGVLQRRGAVLFFCSQRSGGGQAGVDHE